MIGWPYGQNLLSVLSIMGYHSLQTNSNLKHKSPCSAACSMLNANACSVSLSTFSTRSLAIAIANVCETRVDEQIEVIGFLALIEYLQCPFLNKGSPKPSLISCFLNLQYNAARLLGPRSVLIRGLNDLDGPSSIVNALAIDNDGGAERYDKPELTEKPLQPGRLAFPL